jgi:hypothetical protein
MLIERADAYALLTELEKRESAEVVDRAESVAFPLSMWK